jgi:hypothetical protein
MTRRAGARGFLREVASRRALVLKAGRARDAVSEPAGPVGGPAVRARVGQLSMSSPRTTTTGDFACWVTWRLTEPSRVAVKPL